MDNNSKRQENHDQVVGGGHQHHAGDGKEQQGVILAALGIITIQVIIREGNGDQSAEQEQDRQG